MSSEPHRRREGRFGGVRLVGVFLPWQAVAVVLASVVGLTALAVSGRSDGPGAVRVEQSASAEEVTTTTAPPMTTSTSAPEPSTTTTTEPPTTTTTVAPTTTTSAVPPGSSEVVIMSGISHGFGKCHFPMGDWNVFNNCIAGGPPREEFVFTVDTRRFPKGAEFRFEPVVAVGHNSTMCLRLWDLTASAPLAGSERCWTAPAVPPPAPYVSWPPFPEFSERVGPVTFPAGAHRFTVQARALKAGTAEGCVYGMETEPNCGGLLNRAKVLIEWG